MRWLLAGCYGLALISLSAALNMQVTQKPRFYGLKTNHMAIIMCRFKSNTPATVSWYKAETYNSEKREVKGERVDFYIVKGIPNTILSIRNLTVQDSGLYFCRINSTWGPGTQLKVVRPIDLVNSQYRMRMKDGLIIFQAFLLAACIAAILLRKHKLLEKGDSIYEEPETDHIYEGLAIETCGGGLYEELSVYAQADGAEAPWE